MGNEHYTKLESRIGVLYPNNEEVPLIFFHISARYSPLLGESKLEERRG